MNIEKLKQQLENVRQQLVNQKARASELKAGLEDAERAIAELSGAYQALFQVIQQMEKEEKEIADARKPTEAKKPIELVPATQEEINAAK